jgi:hypothetical protein
MAGLGMWSMGVPAKSGDASPEKQQQQASASRRRRRMGEPLMDAAPAAKMRAAILCFLSAS